MTAPTDRFSVLDQAERLRVGRAAPYRAGSQKAQNRIIRQDMIESSSFQIYLVPVRASQHLALSLPPDAGWIFTSPDPAADSVAERLGDASDRPVQVVNRFSDLKLTPDRLVEAVMACVRSGPNPVLVVNAELADQVRELVREDHARVQDLTCLASTAPEQRSMP